MCGSQVQSQPVEHVRLSRGSVTELPRGRRATTLHTHSAATGQTARPPPALPWPEVPLLSASKQHRVQRGVLTKPSDVERSDPGAVELKGKASHSSNKNLRGPSPARAERDTEMRCNVRALLSAASWPGDAGLLEPPERLQGSPAFSSVQLFVTPRAIAHQAPLAKS